MRIAICDDEKIITEHLRTLIMERLPGVKTDLFLSGKELLSSDKYYDIIFLDVEMPEPDGFETARLLRARDRGEILIFLTGHRDMVYEAFKVNTFRYLLKPIQEEDLFEALDAAKQQLEKTDKRQEEASIFIQSNGVHTRIKVRDIIMAEVFDRTISLKCENGTFDYYGKLKELTEKTDEMFFCPHRSFLINLAYVESYDAHKIRLKGGNIAILSKKKYPEFVKAYMKALKC